MRCRSAHPVVSSRFARDKWTCGASSVYREWRLKGPWPKVEEQGFSPGPVGPQIPKPTTWVG